MTRFRLRLWTGPTSVRPIADAVRKAGYADVLEGTEHIHVTAEGTEPSAAFHNLCADLINTNGSDFGLRNPVVIRRED